MIKTLTIAGKTSLGWFPSTYDATKAYPCIAFLPGKGEAGMAGTSGLTVHGPHKFFTNGAVVGPDVIILSISPGSSSGCPPQQCAAIVKDIAAQFKVTKIYPTGLSIGAQCWMNYIFQPGADLSLIGGVLLFSTDTPNVAPYGTDVIDYSIFKKYNLFSYGGCGTADPFYSSLPNNMLLMYGGVKAQNPPIPPILDVWAGVGHSDPVWSDGYNPVWKSPGMGVDIYTKVAQLSPAASSIPPVVTPPVVTPPAPAPKTIKSILITYSDGSQTALP